MKHKFPKYYSPLMTLTVIAALTACNDEEFLREDNNLRPTEFLVFSASMSSDELATMSRSTASHLEIEEENWTLSLKENQSPASRGSLITLLNGNEAGVIGFNYDSSDASKTPIEDDNNISFTFSHDELSATGTPIRWNKITKENLDIYAYAPRSVDGLSVNAGDSPTLTYTVPRDISKQKDIIVSKWSNSPNVDYKGLSIPLNFSHALTAVRLRVGFDCVVKSVEISGVYQTGIYDFATNNWIIEGDSDDQDVNTAPADGSYTIEFEGGKSFAAGSTLNDDANTLILLPQTLPTGASITLVTETSAGDKTLTADISSLKWRQGKLIQYTLYQGQPPTIVYFDLAAGNIDINKDTYSGYRFENGKAVLVSDKHHADNNYYVYQSTETNRSSVGVIDNEFIRPVYGTVMSPDGTQEWRDFIVNNTDVDYIISSWCKGSDKVATDAGRTGTDNHITIKGELKCDLTIDNIYSTYQEYHNSRSRQTAGISFIPSGHTSRTTIKMIGENRLGAVHYQNEVVGNQIIFEGSGSLTVADVDGIKESKPYNESADYFGLVGESGYNSNWWASAIGGADDINKEQSKGIVINSGRIFAGTTKAENCTAIGGGGNGIGIVTINGGLVTAVATTTGTAIGGGIGFKNKGGVGEVTITGGNVYAYNFANRWLIPSSAIGGAGSSAEWGNTGNVTISGGSIYAVSELGTAIGGGSSYTNNGGDAVVTITGGEIIAKTMSPISTSIGGGTAYTQTGASSGTTHFDGGKATITIRSIKDNPIIRTGSIGGGGTGDKNGYLGNATVNVYGGDIQAQFILAAGTREKPSFTMTGGTIRNSNTRDPEYLHVRYDGGAVYLEDGTVNIQGGTITKCSADNGGAIYIKGSTSSSFNMTGGSIIKNSSSADGGAIYMEIGDVKLMGGSINDNLTVAGNGGGVYINGGNLDIPVESTIEMRQNSAQEELQNNAIVGGYGGAIYLSSSIYDIKANIAGGTIFGNTSDNKGGGICVDMKESTLSAKVTIGIVGGSSDKPMITKNSTLMQGGGLYARGQNANITMNSGSITDNQVSQYVTNEDITNEMGSVTLIGGNVTHNVITFHANNRITPEQTATQNIVTSTNSILQCPTNFSRTGYRLIGWNTQENGNGANYSNGQVMNISKDMHLYARWEPIVQ